MARDEKDMDWVDLELFAIAERASGDLGQTARARAEIRRRESEQRAKEIEGEIQRETERREFEEKLVKTQIQAARGIADIQTEASKDMASAQRPVAKFSMWAAVAAAAAAWAAVVFQWARP